jgi:hypothetical protein
MKRIVAWLLSTLAWCVLPSLAVIVALISFLWIDGLFHNHRPPQIAAGVDLISGNADALWSAVLHQKFPPGTSEATLKSTLLSEGFTPVPPPPANCLRPGDRPKVGVLYIECYDSAKQLKYKWNEGLVCSSTMSVAWTTDDTGALTSVKGGYYSACL